MIIDLNAIIIKFRFLEQKLMKATFTIKYGELKISGWRVLDSKHPNKFGDNIWIVPPCYKGSDGKNHPIVFFDPQYWEDLEERICTKYKIDYDKFIKKKFNLPE